MQDDALKVAELLAGEGVAAEGEELFHARRVHLHLRAGTGVRTLQPGSSTRELARSPPCLRPSQAGLGGLQRPWRRGSRAPEPPYLLAGDEQCCYPQELEAVGSHRGGGEKAVEDVDSQAECLQGEPEMPVHGDEPADQLAARLCRHLRHRQWESGEADPGLPRPLPAAGPAAPTCGCRASGSRGWKRLSSPLRERYQLSP